MSDHDFCRSLMGQVMADVRKHVPVEDRKKAWAYKFDGFGSVEFHGPNDFYWHGGGCCKWMARYEGWSAYLAKLAREGNKELKGYLHEFEKEAS